MKKEIKVSSHTYYQIVFQEVTSYPFQNIPCHKSPFFQPQYPPYTEVISTTDGSIVYNDIL